MEILGSGDVKIDMSPPFYIYILEILGSGDVKIDMSPPLYIYIMEILGIDRNTPSVA